MAVCGEAASGGELAQRTLFPDRGVILDEIDDAWLEDEEAAVHIGAIAIGFFLKRSNQVLSWRHPKYAEAAGRLDCGKGCIRALRFVERNELGDVNIPNTISVGKAECVGADVVADAAEAPTGHR